MSSDFSVVCVSSIKSSCLDVTVEPFDCPVKDKIHVELDSHADNIVAGAIEEVIYMTMNCLR